MQRAIQTRVAGALLAGALLFGIGLSGAGVSTAFASMTPVRDAQARAIALHRVPGRVVGLEQDHAMWEVRVRDTHGELKEVRISPNSGRVEGVEDLG